LLLLNIKTISDKQLNELWKVKTRLALPGVNSLTTEQVKVLSNVEQLVLSGLRKITIEQAKILWDSNVKVLYLDWLDWWGKETSITDDIARELAKIPEVYIYHITDNQRKILGNSLKW
jgi:hypothetical protein